MNNPLLYLYAPIVGYLVAGTLKFLINSIKLKKLAFSEIGLGNFPSTHNCIVSTTFFTIGLTEGFTSPTATLAMALCLIVTIDSIDLRKKIENHAILLEELSNKDKFIRTKLGHDIYEVIAGYLIGIVLALILTSL